MIDRRIIGYSLYACIVTSNRAIGFKFPSDIVYGFRILEFINEDAYNLICKPKVDCYGCVLLYKPDKEAGYSCVLSYIKSLIYKGV